MSRTMYKASTWAEIAIRYGEVFHKATVFEPVLLLIQQIAGSRYASGTYVQKSMFDLFVVQTPEYDPNGEFIKISYDPELREFTFRLQETASIEFKDFIRKCAAKDGFRTFERILELKKWFLQTKVPDHCS
jgi:hypothetical protein